jgi:hypothetical protein
MPLRQLGAGPVLPTDVIPKSYADAGGSFIKYVTAAVNPAVAGGRYLCNATAGGFTVTLPLAPRDGTIVFIAKVDGTANLVSYINATGDTIAGVPGGGTPLTAYSAVLLTYSAATTDWVQEFRSSSYGLYPPGHLVARDGNAQVQMPAPFGPTDTANKTYVDSQARFALVVTNTVSPAVVGRWYLCDATSTAFTVTLPSQPVDGAQVMIEKTDSGPNLVSYIRGGGGDTIEGSIVALTLAGNDAVELTYVAASHTWYLRRFLSVATPGTVMRRDANGNSQVATPAAPGDIAIKSYVDGAIPPGAWTAYTPALTAATTNPTLGTASRASGGYTKQGKTVNFWFAIVFGTSGFTAGSGAYRVSLPLPPVLWTDSPPIGVGWYAATGGTVVTHLIPATSYVSLYYDSAAIGTLTVVTHAVPGAPVASGVIRGSGTYETT